MLIYCGGGGGGHSSIAGHERIGRTKSCSVWQICQYPDTDLSCVESSTHDFWRGNMRGWGWAGGCGVAMLTLVHLNLQTTLP